MLISIKLVIKIWTLLSILGAIIVLTSNNKKEYIKDLHITNESLFDVIFILILYYTFLPIALFVFIKEKIKEKFKGRND